MRPVPETSAVLHELAKYENRETLADFLAMGQRAKEIVPECVGLSLGVVEDGLTFTLVATSHELAVLDAVQYVDGGPCVSASERADLVEAETDDLLDEDRWLMYAGAGAAAGIASTLSLPILRGDRVVATVNLYAATADAFEGRREELATALGASAEAAVSNADLGFTTRVRAAEAPTRLAELEEIDLAVGIIAVSRNVSVSSAKARLQEAAARAGVSTVEAARAINHMHSR